MKSESGVKEHVSSALGPKLNAGYATEALSSQHRYHLPYHKHRALPPPPPPNHPFNIPSLIHKPNTNI